MSSHLTLTKTSASGAHRTATFDRYEHIRAAITERYRRRIAAADPAIGYSSLGFLLARNAGNADARLVHDRFQRISTWLYTRRRREDLRADHRDHLAEHVTRDYCARCTSNN